MIRTLTLAVALTMYNPTCLGQELLSKSGELRLHRAGD